MNPTGISAFNQARIEWAIRLKYSPMPQLDLDMLASQLNAFRIGELRVIGKTWEVMMERDGELAVNSDKRKADAAGLEWQIVSDGSLDGDKHAAALQYFYENLTATKALDQDSTGGTDELIYQTLSALDNYYSAHEMLLRVDNPAAKEVTAEFRHTPIWFMEARRGYLGYLKHIFDMYGTPCVAGEWLTAVNQGWMRPLSMIFALKAFALRDWSIFNARYGSGFLDGQTTATKDSPEWGEALAAMQSLANDAAVLHNDQVVFKFLEQSARNNLPFHPMVDWCNSLYAKVYRGVDLATGSKSSQPGAGGQAGGSKNAVGASVQKEESGIFLIRDAKWLTGVFNERIDRPIIRYLFKEEPRAWFALMPPLDDTNSEDLQAIQALVPMGLKIALKEVYKRFRWSVPDDNDPCLTPPAQAVPAPNGEDDEPALDEAGNPVPAKTKTATPNPKAPCPPPEAKPKQDGKTRDAMSDEETPIAPGADPARNPGLATPSGKAYQSAASRQMPDTQVDAAAGWSATGLTARGPALGYAVPNDRLEHLSEIGLGNSRAAQSLRREISKRAAEARQIALANAEKDVPEKIADELRAIIAKMINPALAEKFIAGLQGKTPEALGNIGDLPGHEFHGNQFTESVGKVNDVMSGKIDEAAYAKVSPDTAAKIKAATGKDVSGYQHFIDHDALVHIDKQHGVGNEDQEGHLPITKDDVAKIPHIVANPDKVENGGMSQRGVQTVKYTKRFNGTTYFVEEAWDKEGLLAAKTMFKKATK